MAKSHEYLILNVCYSLVIAEYARTTQQQTAHTQLSQQLEQHTHGKRSHTHKAINTVTIS